MSPLLYLGYMLEPDTRMRYSAFCSMKSGMEYCGHCARGIPGMSSPLNPATAAMGMSGSVWLFVSLFS